MSCCNRPADAKRRLESALGIVLDFYWQKDMDTMGLTGYQTQMIQPAIPREPISDYVSRTLGQLCRWESTDSGQASQDHFGREREQMDGSHFAAL
jgi:hypothetical protein